MDTEQQTEEDILRRGPVESMLDTRQSSTVSSLATDCTRTRLDLVYGHPIKPINKKNKKVVKTWFFMKNMVFCENIVLLGKTWFLVIFFVVVVKTWFLLKTWFLVKK